MFSVSLPRLARKFWKNTDGFVTIEFVILFPAVIMLILTIIAVCVFLASLSEIHQLATELTRMSLKYVDLGHSSEDVCRFLSDEVLPWSVQGFIFVDVNALQAVECTVLPVPDTTSVSVTYDFGRSEFGGVLGIIGFDELEITRQATMKL